MADRTNFYFRQRVTESELDLAFDLLEQADRNLATDLGVFGIITGAEPTPHQPVPDLSIDLTAPTKAYDQLGQRIAFGTDQTVDCTVDHNGIPTEVPSAGQERWLGVFLQFDRLLSDPRTDGNSQPVFFRHDESFQLVVRQGPAAPIGSAPRVPLEPDKLLICDVRRSHGQSQVLAEDLATDRRQAFVFAHSGAVAVQSGLWEFLSPSVDTVQSTLDQVDAAISAHFSGTDFFHSADEVGFSPHGFLESTTVGDALAELVDALSRQATGNSGAKRIGADAAPGAPHALPSGTVDGQLALLLAWLNQHVGAASGAHNASAIAAQPHGFLSGPSVQAQLQELLADLASQAPSQGAAHIGNANLPGTPKSLSAGTLRQQLLALLGHLNDHIDSGDHDARYYQTGHQVPDADTVDGQHAAEFAAASHDHDERYLRQSYQQAHILDANEDRLYTTLSDPPDLVTVAYNYLDTSGAPEATTYVVGSHTPNIRCWVTKRNPGTGKEYDITVQNRSSSRLFITLAVYRRSS